MEEWDKEMEGIRDILHSTFDVRTDFCLMNFYKDGSDSLAQHSDGELNAKNGCVFTLSLGSTRTMKFTGSINKETSLDPGDLLMFYGRELQREIKHGIPPTTKKIDKRMSIVFRGANKR